jgi:hypothetical protein
VTDPGTATTAARLAHLTAEDERRRAAAAAQGIVVGRQTPHVWSAPPCVSNSAVEVVEFMAQIGQPMDIWQEFTLWLWLGERPDGKWASFENACFVQRQNGKGGVTEARELGGLFLFGEKRIIHTAHRIDTARQAFQRCVELVTGMDDLRRRVKAVTTAHSEESIELIGGAELSFRTRIRGSGRGLAKSEVLILDEALALKGEHVEALAPTMLAAPNAQLILTSTPPESSEAYIMDVKARCENRTDPRLAAAVWFNPQGVDIEDPAVQAEVNPTYGDRIDPERMEDMRKLLAPTPGGFERECIGIWPRPNQDTEWLVIPEVVWWARQVPGEATDVGNQIVGRVAVAVDVKPDRAMASVSVAGLRADGGVLGEVVEHRPGTRWVVPRLQELEARHDIAVIVVNDPGVADECEDDEVGLVVHRPTVADVVAACSTYHDGVVHAGKAAVEGRDVWHLGQPELTVGVRGALKRLVSFGKNWAWDRKEITVDVCPLVSATLAVWAVLTPRIHRLHRAPAAAYVDLGPARRRRGSGEPEDVNSVRVREQLARDLARVGMV